MIVLTMTPTRQEACPPRSLGSTHPHGAAAARAEEPIEALMCTPKPKPSCPAFPLVAAAWYWVYPQEEDSADPFSSLLPLRQQEKKGDGFKAFCSSLTTFSSCPERRIGPFPAFWENCRNSSKSGFVLPPRTTGLSFRRAEIACPLPDRNLKTGTDNPCRRGKEFPWGRGLDRRGAFLSDKV